MLSVVFLLPGPRLLDAQVAPGQTAPPGVQPPPRPSPGKPAPPTVDPAAAAQPTTVPKPPENEPAGKRIKFEVHSATLAEAVDALAMQFPEVNIVVPPSLAHVPVTVRLRSVTLDQALRAISLATEGGVIFQQDLVNLYSAAASGNMSSSRAACRIYSLADYLAQKEPKDVELAISDFHKALNMTMELLREANPGERSETPRLELHGPTKLLIAVGNAEQLEVVSQMVGALQGAQAGHYGAASPAGANPSYPGALPGPGLAPRGLPYDRKADPRAIGR